MPRACSRAVHWIEMLVKFLFKLTSQEICSFISRQTPLGNMKGDISQLSDGTELCAIGPARR